MDKKQIIQWARQAVFSVHDGVVTGGTFDLKAFAKLVAAHEREACAKVCDEVGDFFLADDYAAAIRARGNNA
jgi:hypothetical protein